MEREFIKLVLDLSIFDERPFASEIKSCMDQGISFSSIAELGDTEANRLRLYELNKLCSRDIPGRGEFFSYEEFSQRRFGEHYDPCGVIIGIFGNQWIGMCATSNHSAEVFASTK